MDHVGIVVPTYNRAHVLQRCLESIRAQTYAEFRCVIVDDGSTDQTGALLETLCQRDSRFRWVRRTTSGGPSVARNQGVAEVIESCAWIAFCDSDDVWQPLKLEKQRLACTETQVCHTDEQWIRNGSPLRQLKKHRKSEGRIFLQCLPLCCVSPSSIMLSREAWVQVGGFDERFLVCEDYELWLRLFARYGVSLCSEPLVVKYGGHDDQLSRRFVGVDRWRVAALLKLLLNPPATLSSEEVEALRAELEKKLAILHKGYVKHQGEQAAAIFAQILQSLKQPQRLSQWCEVLIDSLPITQTE